MKPWFYFLSLSYTAGYTAGVMGKKRGKGGCFRKNKQKACESKCFIFLKHPPNNRGEIHWVTCPPHTLQKKTTFLQIQNQLFIGFHFSISNSHLEYHYRFLCFAFVSIYKRIYVALLNTCTTDV